MQSLPLHVNCHYPIPRLRSTSHNTKIKYANSWIQNQLWRDVYAEWSLLNLSLSNARSNILMNFSVPELQWMSFVEHCQHHIRDGVETLLLLTHWGRVKHICVGNLTIIGSNNGLPPGRRQAIIWTNAGILLIGPLGTNFNEIVIVIQTFSFKKMHLKMSYGKWRPLCLKLNVLTHWPLGNSDKILDK